LATSLAAIRSKAALVIARTLPGRASKRSIHRHSASMAGFSGGIRLSSAFLGNAATLLFY